MLPSRLAFKDQALNTQGVTRRSSTTAVLTQSVSARGTLALRTYVPSSKPSFYQEPILGSNMSAWSTSRSGGMRIRF